MKDELRKEWQIKRGKRYGNRRKEVARLKRVERKRDRQKQNQTFKKELTEGLHAADFDAMEEVYDYAVKHNISLTQAKDLLLEDKKPADFSVPGVE